jgi:hypothetical protein
MHEANEPHGRARRVFEKSQSHSFAMQYGTAVNLWNARRVERDDFGFQIVDHYGWQTNWRRNRDKNSQASGRRYFNERS